MLEEGKKVHPNAQWWIKADGCDLLEVLGESVNGDWSGDVDLNDGKVAEQRSEYLGRLSHLEDLCKDLTNRDECSSELSDELSQLHKDMEFVSKRKFSSPQVCDNVHDAHVMYIRTHAFAHTRTQFCRRQILNMRTKSLLDMLSKKLSMA